MSLTSYRAAPPRGKLGGQSGGQSRDVKKGQLNLNINPWSHGRTQKRYALLLADARHILLADLATTYSPAP